MSASHSEDVRKHVRIYISVFVALMVLTVVTVAISYLHLNVGTAILLALVVATIKATLVAGYFMHLLTEKRLIYVTLIITAVFFIVLMALPVSFYNNSISQ